MLAWFTAFDRSAFGQGMLSNVLNLDHLCFALMIGLMLGPSLQKSRLMIFALFGNALGIGAAAPFLSKPVAQFFVALSLVLLIAIVSAPEFFERSLTLIFGGIGLLHGALHAQRFGLEGSPASLTAFTLGVLLGTTLLALSFHFLLEWLARKPKDLSGEMKHIVVAIASGSALAYLVMSFS